MQGRTQGSTPVAPPPPRPPMPPAAVNSRRPANNPLHGVVYHGGVALPRMLNTRGVSSLNDSHTNNTRMSVRKTCIVLYFIHGTPVLRILERCVSRSLAISCILRLTADWIWCCGHTRAQGAQTGWVQERAWGDRRGDEWQACA